MNNRKYTVLCQAVIGAIFVLSLLPVRASAAITADKATAVVFVYQRIGEDSVPQSNISVDQLKEHIEQLKKGGYSVLPLPKIIDAIKNSKDLPPKTVGITFEGAYQTTLTNAIPLLEAENLPFTIFFATDMQDNNNPTRMTWDQIKKLQKNKLISFGLLTSTYDHMITNSPEENAALINRAIGRYREVMDKDPEFFSYPYGEFNSAVKKQLAGYKFKAVFGQHSGVIHAGSDFLSLPRFTMTNEFGDLDRFMLTADALPLPVTDVVPEDNVITDNPPIIGFSVTPEITNLGKLSCFASSLGKLPLSRIGNNRVEIRPTQPFSDRRTRINCTLPDETQEPGEAQRWRWFGLMLVLPGQEEEENTVDVPHSTQDSENPPADQ